MERMSEEEFINNIEEHITSLKNLDNKALKILVGKLEEENETLKDNVEFLHACLDDRDKSIAIMEEENKKLKEENEKWKDTVKTQNEYNKFRIADNERLKEDSKKLESAIGDLVRENRELKEERDKYYAEWHGRHS